MLLILQYIVINCGINSGERRALMNDATKRAVTNALDNTLMAVVPHLYEHFEQYEMKRGRKISDRVSYALKELAKLRGPDIPDYDDAGVALLYYWYQPRQINLAYSLITSEAVGGITSDRLRVIDFGCGALAMQFGVALAAADALEQGIPISEIRIDSIDSSKLMISVGENLWKQFKIEVSDWVKTKDQRLAHVKEACAIIKPQVTQKILTLR